MNKKILILMVVLILVGIGAYFIFPKLAFSQLQTGKCGDGICDSHEQANPNLCPKDCQEETPQITQRELERGWYWGSYNQKKIGAPDDWIHTLEGTRSACWHKPEVRCGQETNQTTQFNPNELQGNQANLNINSENSPFGIMAAFDISTLTTISTSDKIAWAGEKFRDLGAKWSRGAGEKIFWGVIEPEFGNGYNWTKSDKVLKNVYQNGGENFNMVVIISSQRAKGGSSDIPRDKENYFSSFVEALVERYDGDGIVDYNPIIKVKYWQMDNEPFPRHWESAGGTIDGYVRFAELTHDAIKKSDPDAKIILGTFQFETPKQIAKLNEVIPKMKDKNLFDYVDTHYWNSGNNYKISLTEAKNIFDSNGYSNVKHMSLEFGTWAERKGRGTEKDQAKYVIKGYIYNIANGFTLINWNNLVEWPAFGGNPRSIYNFMGLIADGQNEDPFPAGTPRLAYYTYKKMVEILEGSDWDNIQTIQESDGIYIYRFAKQGKLIWVAWNDNAERKQITISNINSGSVKITEAVPKYESGAEVIDYSTAFKTETKSVINNTALIVIIGEAPLLIETE